MKNKVTVYSLSFTYSNLSIRENWFERRNKVIEFYCDKEGEEAAEYAFKITNCPTELLSKKDIKKIKNFHGPSLSVGDIVRVENYFRISGDNNPPKYYLCKSFGWEEYNDNLVELVKYLPEP